MEMMHNFYSNFHDFLEDFYYEDFEFGYTVKHESEKPKNINRTENVRHVM